MEQQKYLYDAFISYRHTEPDKFVAETLHKKMETYKPPKAVLGKSSRKKITRVFRDQDELPLASNLEDPIVEALKQSEYLIVICSPRLRESMWCKKEIQTFIQFHGRKKILAVLAEGEPEESFPEELLYDECQVMDELGVFKTIKKPVEPLAADFRGANREEIKKAMKSEILRLLAPMFGASYDDLRQRHKEWRMRRILMGCALVGAASLAFGIVSTATAIKIQRQKEQISIQNVQLTEQKEQLEVQKNQIQEQAEAMAKDQALYLAKESESMFAQDDRQKAISLAMQAMTEYQGVKMPQTPEAEAALVKSLGVYDGGRDPRALDQVSAPGVIQDFTVSPNGHCILTADNLGNLILWDTINKKKLYECQEEEVVSEFDFLDDEAFYYVADNSKIMKVRWKEDATDIYDLEETSMFSFVYDAELTSDRTKLVVQDFSSIDVIDMQSMTLVASTQLDQISIGDMFLSKDAKYAAFIGEVGDTNDLILLELDTCQEVSRIDISKLQISDGLFVGDKIYLLGYFQEDLSSATTSILAIDSTLGTILYRRDFEDYFSSHMEYNEGGDEPHLLLFGSSLLRLLSATTGEELKNYSVDGKDAMVRTTDSGDFYIYQEDGLCNYIKGVEPYNSLGFPFLTCSTVQKFATSAGGLAGMLVQDSRLIFYTYLNNVDGQVYAQEGAEPVEKGMVGETAKEWAQGLDLENAAFVNSCVYLEDLKQYVVRLVDDSFVVYQADTMEILHKGDSLLGTNLDYYGKVGPYYVIGSNLKGYLFDESGQVHGVINYFHGISQDRTGVLVEGTDENGEYAILRFPVYTKEELIRKVK